MNYLSWKANPVGSHISRLDSLAAMYSGYRQVACVGFRLRVDAMIRLLLKPLLMHLHLAFKDPRGIFVLGKRF